MKLKKLAFLTLFLSCFLAQILFQLQHTFEDHQLHLCDDNGIEHICDFESESDQHFFDTTIKIPSSFNYELVNNKRIITIDNLNKTLLRNNQKLSFSLRAPPYYNFI